MQYKIKINAVDFTASAAESDISISETISQLVNTAKLRLKGATSDEANLAEGKEIIVSNPAETVRYFAGHIASVFWQGQGRERWFLLSCRDYTALTETVLINKTYTNQTDESILDNLFSTYLSEVTTADFVSTGVTITDIKFDRVPLRRAVQRLAEISGFHWRVDYNKKLHYESKPTNLASHALSATPNGTTSFTFRLQEYGKDLGDIANQITVRGGKYFSANTTFELVGNGQTKELLLPYVLRGKDAAALPTISTNTGTDGSPTWSAKAVGEDNIDTLPAKDVLWNKDEKLLKFNTAPPNLNRAVQVECQYEIPVLTRVRSQASITQYSRTYEAKIVDTSILSQAAAKDRGRAVLTERAFAKERGKLTTWQDGLSVGDLVTITSPQHSISGTYLIHRLGTRLVGGTDAVYTVSFGEYNPDLVDILLALKLQADVQDPPRDGEVLLELLEWESTLGLVETAVTREARGLTYFVDTDTPTGGPTDIKAGYWKAS